MADTEANPPANGAANEVEDEETKVCICSFCYPLRVHPTRETRGWGKHAYADGGIEDKRTGRDG